MFKPQSIPSLASLTLVVVTIVLSGKIALVAVDDLKIIMSRLIILVYLH